MKEKLKPVPLLKVPGGQSEYGDVYLTRKSQRSVELRLRTNKGYLNATQLTYSQARRLAYLLLAKIEQFEAADRERKKSN